MFENHRTLSSHRPTWIEVAISRAVVKRALAFMVIVGGILIAINHGDAILLGEIDSVRAFKMFLTPLVPYMVSTLSSVSVIRSAPMPLSSPEVSGEPSTRPPTVGVRNTAL